MPTTITYRPTPRKPVMWGALAAAVVVAALALAGYQRYLCPTCGPDTSQPAAEASGWFDPKLGTQLPPTSAGKPAREPAALRQMLQTTGSLRDSEADGGWAVDAQGRLVPALQVRQRFEYFLGAGGEVSDAEIRALIEDDARRHLQPPAVAEAIALYDRYLQARGEASKFRPDTRDAGAMRAALSGLHAARERILGRDWSEAFYGAEESYFETQIQRVELANSGPAGAAKAAEQQAGDSALLVPGGKDPAALREARTQAYGAEAAGRMEQVDAQWAQWNARIERARQEVARIRASAALSEPQKRAEVLAYVDGNFSAGSERLRARSILQAQ